MKKVFVLLSCFLIIFSFPLVSFAKGEWHSVVAEPSGAFGEYYLADKSYIYQFVSDLEILQRTNANITVQGIECLADPSIGNNSVRLYFENRSGKVVHLYYNRFNLLDGTASLSRQYTINIPTNDREFYIDLSLVAPASEGVWSSGITWLSFQTFLPLSITWAETPDYSTDFAAFTSYLSDIADDVDDISYDLSVQLPAINTKLQNFYTLFNTNWTWFKETYYNFISGKWISVESKLDQIIALLQGQDQTTIPVDESYADDMSNYVQSEHNLMSQAEINPGEINSNINEAFAELPQYSNGFYLIRQIFDAFITGMPHVYIVLLFSLTFGIILTVIGKRMS